MFLMVFLSSQFMNLSLDHFGNFTGVCKLGCIVVYACIKSTVKKMAILGLDCVLSPNSFFPPSWILM